MKSWLIYALTTTVLWGIWGAFTEVSEKNGLPGSLGYVVWSLTMLIPAVVSLLPEQFRIDRDPKSIYYGMVIGLSGAGGTVALFEALALGPAYLVFPIIALSPVVTVILSFSLLKERAGPLGAVGVALALVSIVLFSITSPEQSVQNFKWLLLAIGIMLAWGVQAYYMKLANTHMSSASIFFYMTLTGLMCIPLAIGMTDFNRTINWGWSGAGLCAVVQLLNAIGACTLVFAFRDGKAIIVSPLCNALAPLITVSISLALHRTLPSKITATAILTSLLAATLMLIDEQRPPTPTRQEPRTK